MDSNRPRQVNLRRSVSAAYYSLFHLLLDGIEKCFTPAVRRSVDHQQMAEACRLAGDAFQIQENAAAVLVALPLRGLKLTIDLYTVTTTFCDLQQARHRADYDTRARSSRAMVQTHLIACRDAHEAWRKIQKQAQARGLLTMMLVDFKRLRDRS